MTQKKERRKEENSQLRKLFDAALRLYKSDKWRGGAGK